MAPLPSSELGSLLWDMLKDKKGGAWYVGEGMEMGRGQLVPVQSSIMIFSFPVKFP
jgi:hypothetical protein